MRREVIGNCELYHGDCLDILGEIGKVNTVVTDPVWPDNSVSEFKDIEPYDLLEKMWKLVDGKIDRAVFHLGCNSNPRILYPVTLPFFRVARMEYPVPGQRGRLLNDCDIVYMFGAPPKSIPGKRLIGGKRMSTNNFGKEAEHPCPRKLEHVKWQVYQFTNQDDIVLDPFMGSGTTGVACVDQEHARKFIGIEINEKYFDTACKRIEKVVSQGVFDFRGSE